MSPVREPNTLRGRKKITISGKEGVNFLSQPIGGAPGLVVWLTSEEVRERERSFAVTLMSFASRRILGWARWTSSQPKWTGSCFQRREATVGSTVAGVPSLKTFQELPGVGFWSFVYWFLLRGYILHTHELQLLYKKLYGPMWKYAAGRETSVSIASPEIMEKMMRQEGKYPMRCDMAEWKEHRDLRGLAYGPLTEEGERWYRLRQVLNKRMLKPSVAGLYADAINEVVSDLMVHLKNEREKSPCGMVVQDVANQLYRFALEGISYILFETRIGCLQKQIPAKTQDFINSIGLMFKNFVFVNALPKWTREVLPFWKRYLESWDTIFAFGQTLIDKRMEEITAQLEKGEKPKGEYLTYLLSSEKVTIEEVSGSVAELLMAGVDTTSNTLAWTLYHLAKDTEIQGALFQEVVGVVPKEQIPTTEDLARMPLLKAVIKETLRLYPVVPVNSRVAMKDVIIEGYHFPKGTLFSFCHFALSRDEANFPEPNKFVPQRWLREEHASSHHPFSSIPFGYGVRGCVGRRIAELEMHLALARIIQKYEIRPDPQGTEVKPLARVVLVADRPINLQFLDRQTDSSHAFG